jgi:hypothetical protein
VLRGPVQQLQGAGAEQDGKRRGGTGCTEGRRALAYTLPALRAAGHWPAYTLSALRAVWHWPTHSLL